MPKAVADRLHALTGIDYIEGYGLTETIAPTHINPYHRPKRQCGGIPIFDTDSRVVDPDTLAELGPGAVGEVVRSEEHTSELQSLMRTSSAAFCLKKQMT